MSIICEVLFLFKIFSQQLQTFVLWSCRKAQRILRIHAMIKTTLHPVKTQSLISEYLQYSLPQSTLLSVSTFPQHPLFSPLLSSSLLSCPSIPHFLSDPVFTSIPHRSHTICLHPEFPFRSSEAPPCP